MAILDRLREDTRGNIAMMFALLLIPLIGGAGVAIEMYRLSDRSIRARQRDRRRRLALRAPSSSIRA